MDISLLSSLTAIHYDEGNLAFLKASLLHFDCGIQLQCTSGEGILHRCTAISPTQNVRTYFLGRKYHATYRGIR